MFNRTVSKVDKFIDNEAKGTNVLGTHSIEVVYYVIRAPNVTCVTRLQELCASLKKPRRVMLLVMAGPPVDSFIDQACESCD